VVAGLPYLLPYVVPLAIVAGSRHGALWPFRIVPAIFVAVTLIDTVVRRRTTEPLPDGGIGWRVATVMWLPAQAAIVWCGLIAVARPPDDLWAAAMVTVAVGMTGGMMNVPAAHELMHGAGAAERLCGELLMALLTYPHFCVEHVHGHHVRVATPDDAATAPLGQSVYAFVPRAAIRGWVNAWRFEAGRLRARNLSPISLRNRVVRGTALCGLIYGLVAYGFGARGVLFFVAQSVVGFSMLEVINYVQHYGLVRRQLAAGRWEHVTPMHAWNSAHPVSNWFLLNLGHHAAHHCDAGRSYRSLPYWHESPQLPLGLFAMFALALCPPLWRAVMDPLVARAQSRTGELSQARQW
jgi:alkane 1-monooxygenase